MSLDKLRLRFPLDVPEKCREEKMENVLEDIKFSKRCFVLYEADDSKVELLFTGLDEEMLELFFVYICKDERFYKFLKMGLLSKERAEKNYKKGLDLLELAKKYCKENFSDMLARED